MDYVYYLGNKEIQGKISRSLQLIGCLLIERGDFKITSKNEVIIYALRKDLSTFLPHLRELPKNLIIISKGQESYRSFYPGIFIYRDCELRLLEHAFSGYFNRYLSSLKTFEDTSSFYQEREDIYIYYLKITEDIKSLKDILAGGRQPYKIKKVDLEKLKVPGKYFLFISGFPYEMDWLKENYQLLDNIIIVAFGCQKKIKKELKESLLLIPVIFIKALNKKLARLLTKRYYS